MLAYLFKHTLLQSNFFASTSPACSHREPRGRPARAPRSQAILWHFLHFRLEVVTRRLEHELGVSSERIHMLEGFAFVFDALDEIIKIIRKSDGKADAAKTIMARFELDAEQTDAILELKLYRLARSRSSSSRRSSRRSASARRRSGAARRGRSRRGAGASCGASSRSSPRSLGKDAQAPHADRGRRRRPSSRTRTSSSPRTTTCSSRPTAGSSARRRSRTRADAPPRGRPHPRVRGRLDQGDDRVLLELRHRVHARIIDIPATTGYGEPSRSSSSSRTASASSPRSRSTRA